MATALAGGSAAGSGDTAIDWPSFLARHDLQWSAMPRSWEEGGFLGNGLLGAMVYAAGDRHVVWELGRADVIDRRTEPADPML